MLHSVRSDQRRCQGRSSISSRAWRPHHVSFPCQRHRYVELSKWRVVLACVGERVGRRSTESPETLLTLSINSRSETECQAHRSKRRAAMSGRRCHWRRRDNRDGLLSAGMCVCVCRDVNSKRRRQPHNNVRLIVTSTRASFSRWKAAMLSALSNWLIEFSAAKLNWKTFSTDSK